jgi:hypothetical protein
MLIHIITYPQREPTEKDKKQTAQGNSTLNLNNFDDYHFHELDLINIVKLGEWFGGLLTLNKNKNLNLTSQYRLLYTN